MILGIGTDLCENYRVRSLYDRYQQRFLNRVYTDEEIAYCLERKDPVPHLSARYALKEAFIKALGLVNRDLGLSYKEVGIKGGKGKKVIEVTGQLKQMMQQRQVNNVWFSISHGRDYSNAYVILEK